MRWLDQRHIPYEVIEFDDNIHSAEGVADIIGVEMGQVYKTLVVLPDGKPKPLLVMLSADCSLDLKALAKAAGYKRVEMASHYDAEKLTGLKVGGISALALTAKNWQIYTDAAVLAHDHIYMSAGQRGINLKVPTQALIAALNITVVACGLPL